MKKGQTFILTLLCINTIFLNYTLAEDYTRWKLPEGAKLRLGKGAESHIMGRSVYQFLPDSSQFIIFSSIGMWVYDTQTGKELRLITGNTKARTADIVLSPDWQTFACPIDIPNKYEIQLWDFHTDKLQTTLQGYNRGVTSIAFSPNGKILASGHFAGVLRIWDIESGQHRRIPTSYNTVSDLAFSPDGEMIMTWRSGDYRLWDVETGKMKAKIEGTWNEKIEFSPDGQLLISANEREIRTWDADTGKVKMKFKVQNPRYRTLIAVTPDGKTLANMSINKNKVQLLDMHTGQLKKTLKGKPEHVKTIQVDKEGFDNIK